MRSSVRLLAGLLLAVPAAPLSAQSADEAAVIAVVTTFFDGMRARDTALIRSTVTDDATLMTAGGPGGVANRSLISSFIAAVGGATGAPWNEQIIAPAARVDGGVATVWTRYTFALGEAFQHCGVDAVQLVKVGESWKIRHMADSRRKTGCPEAASQDEAPAVLAATQAFLSGLVAKDTAAIRATADSGLILLVAGGPTGTASRTPIAQWLARLANEKSELDERMVQPEVRVDGPLAEVWAPYTFVLNGKFSHCGADAFQLVRSAEGWRVAQLLYSVRPPASCGSLRPA